MKKIVLGCAAVLLSLGLLAGCNNDAPIEDAVLINVDSAASVEVGDTLTLSYSVSPEKATVVAASDNEGIVTAEAQDGLLYLTGVTEGKATVTLVGTYKKYADANVNIAVEVISEATEKTEPGTQQPGTTYPAPTGDEDPAYFGFEVDGVGYYATGTTPESYTYEGDLTTSVEEAVLVSIEKGTAENEFYLSFGEEEATPASALQPYREGDDGDGGEDDNKTYITIVENGGHTNLSYATEKAPIYWNETYGCWGDESEEYFLCYNATYGCLYCSAIASWIDSSPIATLIEPAEVTSLTILGSSSVNVGWTITLEAVVNLGASNAVTWSIENEDNHITVDASTGVVTGVSATDDESPVTVTATAKDSEVTASIEITVVDITFQQVTSLTDGASYYFGDITEAGGHLITGEMSGYNLATTTDLGKAIEVTATGDDESGWTLTLPSGQYIYFYASNKYADLGLSNAETVPNSGTKVFSWDSEANTLYTTASVIGDLGNSNATGTPAYTHAYFEYYNEVVTSYRATSAGTTGFSNAAHLYQVVDAGD